MAIKYKKIRMLKKQFLVAWVCLCSMVAFYTAVDIYTPSMPFIAHDFGVSENTIQWTMTLFMAGSLLSTLFCGPLAERYGMRETYVCGMAICSLFSLICYVSDSALLLLAARFFQGLGGSVTIVLGYAAIQDMYSETESVHIFSLMGSVFATVPALAPILGGVLAEYYGWRSNFLVILITVTSAFVFTYFAFRLPNHSTKPKNKKVTSIFESLKMMRSIFLTPTFAKYTTPHAAQIICEWAIITLLPFYFLSTLKLSPSVYGLVLCGLIIFFGIGSLASKRLIRLHGHEFTVFFSILASLVGGVGLLITYLYDSHQIYGLSFFIALFLFSQGLSFTPSVSNALKPFQGLRATASSVRGTLNAAASLVGAYAATIMPDNTLIPLSVFMIGLCCLSLIIFKTINDKINTEFDDCLPQKR